MTTVDQTQFGAAWADPTRSAAALRAKAAAAGVGLVPAEQVSRTDLAAAVLGAHAWACACGAPSLAGSRLVDASERSALAAVLLRASGHGTRLPAVEAAVLAWSARATTAPSTALLAQLAVGVRWLAGHLEPVEQVQALVCAAVDLLSAGGSRSAAAGTALLAEAETLLEDLRRL